MFHKKGFFNHNIDNYDPVLSKSIEKELCRQQDQIELIASENIVSNSVLQAQGSVLTNKYAEGLPGKRYYGGCEFVDEGENANGCVENHEEVIYIHEPSELLCRWRSLSRI